MPKNILSDEEICNTKIECKECPFYSICDELMDVIDAHIEPTSSLDDLALCSILRYAILGKEKEE